MATTASKNELVQTEVKTTSEETTLDTRPSEDRVNPKDIYEAVLPFILDRLQQPKDAKSLAECLEIRLSQMQDWLKKAVTEGKVRKTNKPACSLPETGSRFTK